MPIDVVQVRGGRWSLRNDGREFHESDLFPGPWGGLARADIADGLDVEYDERAGRVSGVRRYPALPASTRRLVAQHGCRHPGVALDRLACRSGDQSLAKSTLNDVVRVNDQQRDASQQDTQHWFCGLRARWQRTIAESGSGGVQFRCVTSGPLTLHLARASALENAGICLHPLYGFVYLPGTGLKGMARAYAETVWFPGQYAADAAGAPRDEAEADKARDAWHLIEAVFGWAPQSDRDKTWKPRCIRPRDKSQREHSGAIVFHDAWPTEWPKLIVDILNNHHAKYYQGKDAPGDWEGPVPVYFLAVPAETTFEFALAGRRDDVPTALVAQAGVWLQGALCHLGAGAKTNAGYGDFRPLEGERPALTSPRHASFETTLELVTPAFLAGANQQAADCDLRPATVRGLLRWWWRTMHADAVDVVTLQTMETAIWGDAGAGGAVRLTIESLQRTGPFECPGKKISPNKKGQPALNPDPGFVQRYGLEPAPKFTTQGLFYAAYGTDEMKTGDLSSRKRRWLLGAGSQWRVRLTTRQQCWDTEGKEPRQKRVHHSLPPDIIVEQAMAALWLLCQFGGVGSKSRKGFGSLSDPVELTGWSVQRVQDAAERFRQVWRSQFLPYGGGQTDSPSLGRSRQFSMPTRWTDPWFAIDQVGASRQSFAQAPRNTGHGKHCPSKAALGLPRRIHGPLPFPLAHQQGKYTPPEELTGPMGDRYASPVHVHLGKTASGEFEVRVTTFQPARLWSERDYDEQTGPVESDRLLEQLMHHLAQDLTQRAKNPGHAGKGPALAKQPVQSSSPPGRVRVKVLGRNEKLNNAYFVQEEGKPRGELRFGTPPAGQKAPEPDDVLEVYRHNTDPRSPQYRWDPPPSAQPPRRTSGRGGPPRRR